MGFLDKTVFARRLNKTNFFVLAIIAGVISCGLAISPSTFAEEVVDNYGLYTASDGARWEWEVVSDSENTTEPQKLNIMFYDKPTELTTVTVPSYSDITTVSGVTPTSDTYYVRNANQASQDTRFVNPDPARRTGGADVTVLDMTNTSKVQIMGVRPIINPDTEVELIFGENMVIGDEEVEVIKNATLSICAEFVYSSYYNAYECTGRTDIDFENIQDGISGWDEMTLQEKKDYKNLTSNDLPSTGCLWLNWNNRIESYLYDEFINNYSCFVPSGDESVSLRDTQVYGVFSKMHLKLTNLDNVKYLGWYVFSGSTFNEDSRSVTVKANQTAGEGVFADTNVTDVTFEGNVVFPDMFRGCSNLSNIDFGNVETVQYRAFQNTNLGEIDFSQTSIKTILGEAFKNAGITNVNFDGVETIDFRSFEGNDIRELYLPKSINYLGVAVFAFNSNLKKATIAYDTLTSGTMLQFATVLDGYPQPWGSASSYIDTSTIQHTLEELVVLAPYEEGEELKPTHLNYYEYRDAPDGPYYSTTINTQYFNNGSGYNDGIKALENMYADLLGFRNVVAPLYFAFLNGLKSITIGEGFEYLGNAAFISNYSNGTYALARGCYNGGCRKNSPLEIVVLPESLKGIGSLAIQYIYNEDFTMSLPSGLEFIGIAAFSEVYFLKGNVDFPNLRFLGDYAFYSTQVRDIYLHDKIEYIGVGVFNDCPALHDITFDFDVFNPDGHNWWQYGSSGYRNYQLLFGANIAYNSDVMEQLGYTMSDTNNGDVKYGTITFTEKAVHRIPSICEIGYSSCYGDSTFLSGHTQSFFGHIGAERIDLSKAPWEELPGDVFERISVNEFILPETIKKIDASAFLDAHIEEELVLPYGLETIGIKAFSQSGGYQTVCTGHEITITSLPETIKEIGMLAFYNDVNMTADVDLPNLEILGGHAFMGTSIENVALRDKLQTIGNGPFWSVPTIKNIIIDTDLFAGTKYRYYTNTRCDSDYRNPSQLGCYFENSGRLKADSYGYDFKYDSITFTDKVQTLPAASKFFMGLYNIGTLDMGAAKFTRIPDSGFVYTDIDKLILPEGLEEIGREAFYTTKITDEVVLPDTLRVIEFGAFNTYHWSGTPRSDGPIIKKLPDSLEIVGNAAFYMDKNLDTDFDLPNIRRIGQSAFERTSLRNITLHDSIEEPVFCGAFSNIPTMETLTIDYDFYHFNNNDIDYDYYSNRENTWFMRYANFFSVFNMTPLDQYAGAGLFYNQDTVEVKPYVNVVFTEKAVTNPIAIKDSWSNYNYTNAYLNFDKLDLSRTGWTQFDDTYFFQNAHFGELILPENLERINMGAFFGATIDEPIALPSTLKAIGDYAFQEAKVTFANTFNEGLETIGKGAFYAAQVSGDMTIPSTVTSIGWSAFNAGDADTHYSTVTIKPVLNYDSTDSQAVFQMFWNASMDKLVIESPMLPVLAATGDTPVLPHEVQYTVTTNEGTETVAVNPTLRADGEPEFHGMTMREVEIKNLPVITANALEDCANLEKVDLSGHDSLTRISHHAFNNADKLKTFVFGDGLAGKDVALEEYAFRGTAIETMGDKNTDFALSAANFNAEDAAVFSEMPKLTTVYVPSTFTIQPAFADAEKNLNGSTIPAYTFANDPELKEVTLDYQLSKVDESVFLYDNKLEKLFVWGNTNINENDAELTIPEQTTIFAYSDAPAETYANAESRNDYDGKFYALDEVLYLTSNKSKVLLEQDEEGNNIGFDKTGLKLYGLRRDGVILESDWQNYNTAFKRTEAPEGTNISFEEGRGALGPDDAAIAATVFDAPKPFNVISLTNQNFANVDYEFMQMPSNDNPLIIVHYPDGYTGNIRNTTLVSVTIEDIIEEITPDPEPSKPEPAKPETEEPEDELEVPDTGSYGALIGAATSSVSIATIIVLGGIFIAKRRKN